MLPHEIFTQLSPETFSAVFGFFQEKDRALYKAFIESLAKARKLRGVFVERKPRPERLEWLQNALSRKGSDDIAAQVLQVWLMHAHAPLLCDFLDGFGIPHDEKGTVETIPPAPQKAKIAPVVEALLAKYDREVVAVYLHAFQSLDDQGGWAPLGELLAEDSRLKLGQVTLG